MLSYLFVVMFSVFLYHAVIFKGPSNLFSRHKEFNELPSEDVSTGIYTEAKKKKNLPTVLKEVLPPPSSFRLSLGNAGSGHDL